MLMDCLFLWLGVVAPWGRLVSGKGTKIVNPRGWNSWRFALEAWDRAQRSGPRHTSRSTGPARHCSRSVMLLLHPTQLLQRRLL